MLKTNNLSKKFKDTLALDNVNLTVNKGDIYGFVGENGAGKSTLIKIVTNVLNQTSGDFKLNASKRLGSVASIIEEPALHMNLNAFDNLMFQNQLLGLNKNKEDINNTLKLVGLNNSISSKKKTRSFSLGMKQRLSIAMSLLSDPEFILLDEPLNGLDPVGIKDIRELILKLNKEKNITFLISSHMLEELDRVATKYGFISNGKLLEEITVEELHNKTSDHILVTLNSKLDKNTLNIFNKYNYKKISDYEIHIFNKLNVNDVMKDLITNMVDFKDVTLIKKTIEDYYMEIIGGLKHD